MLKQMDFKDLYVFSVEYMHTSPEQPHGACISFYALDHSIFCEDTYNLVKIN